MSKYASKLKLFLGADKSYSNGLIIPVLFLLSWNPSFMTSKFASIYNNTQPIHNENHPHTNTIQNERKASNENTKFYNITKSS